ncbi:hypothetical protein DEO72_LG4g2344 [Vigna unguiculata]|uniref:Uncharacterized protein n=1 Tax=Vigna unguiculata TaxID=3917 RepID=A0A4D6LR08_VIGUN|nr:hypothetical protein DEO72_LG4g2344 [Vigna unguiculata]
MLLVRISGHLRGATVLHLKGGSMFLTLQLEPLVHPLDGMIMMQKWQWHGKLSAMLTVVKIMGLLILMRSQMYNFMPLSRGSAVVGFAVMLGLFLAANMEFTGSIPQGCQVDWEAILSLDPNSFVDSVKSWLYPSLKVTTSWKDYHDVASTFATTGSVVAALSSSDDCTP